MTAQAEPSYEEGQQPDVNTVEDVAQQTAETSTESEVASQDVSKSQPDKEYNWKRARQQMEELQWENKRLREAIEQREKPSSSQEEDYSELEQLASDDILTKAQTLKLSKKETQKLIKETLANFKNEMLMETLEDRIRSKYPDYFSVATEENVDELKRDPLFVKALRGLNNPYDQACYIYRELSHRGYTADQTKEKQQLEKNAAKPRSAHSLGGTSPLHMANDYSGWPSKDLQAKLYQEMTEAAKGA